MTHDNAAARHARAERLRAEIERLKGGGPAAEPSAGTSEERPRDFVERRMRELDAAESQATDEIDTNADD